MQSFPRVKSLAQFMAHHLMDDGPGAVHGLVSEALSHACSSRKATASSVGWTLITLHPRNY